MAKFGLFHWIKSVIQIWFEETGRRALLDCRITMTGNREKETGENAALSAFAASLAKWKRFLPHISYDGQGYEGTFSYDCEWY